MAAVPGGSAGDGIQQQQAPFDADKLSKALGAAMEEARLSFRCTAVVVHGDKALVDLVHATLVESQDVLTNMSKGVVFPMANLRVQKEVASVAAVFADLEALCEDSSVSADGLMAAMDGLHKATEIFVGGDAAAELMPYRPKPTVPLSTKEEKQQYVRDLAKDFTVRAADVKWRCGVPVELESGVVKRQFILVEVNGDSEDLQQLKEHLSGTCKEAQELLARMVAKANKGRFPLTDVVFEEVIGISKAIAKVEAECEEGYATAGAVVAGMDALKTMTAVFAGSGVAAGLRFSNPWPIARLSSDDDKLSYMWNLAATFSTRFYDVKFRCEEL